MHRTKPRHRSSSGSNDKYWMCGRHACKAALSNPARRILKVMASRNAAAELHHVFQGSHDYELEIVTPEQLTRLAGEGITHQGMVMQVEALESPYMDEVLGTEKPLLLLDQVTDPHNVGAILRSAAAFDAAAVIQPQDHGAPENAAMARSAAGALEMIPLLTVSNLSQAIKEIQDAGYWVAGMDGQATQTLAEAKLARKTALVLGAEGKGMRRLTAERCDMLVRLPIHAQMESLNVSNAAAIALYALSAN